MEPFHKSAMDIGGRVDLKIASYDSQSPFRTQKIIPIYCLGYALTIQTLIDTDPPDWSHQIHLWSKGPFLAVLEPMGPGPMAPSMAHLTHKTVPMHHHGCAGTCSTLIPHCSTRLEPPDPLMAKKGRF